MHVSEMNAYKTKGAILNNHDDDYFKDSLLIYMKYFDTLLRSFILDKIIMIYNEKSH